MTKISFTFESEAFYSEDDVTLLKEDLVKATFGFDDEMIQSTADLAIVAADSDEKSKEREVVNKLLANGTFTVKLVIGDADGEDFFETELSTEEA